MRYTAYRGQRREGGVRNSLLVLLLGVGLGVLSKWADFSCPWLSDLTSGVPLWVLLGCVFAIYSRTAARAALHVALLLGGMVAAYYTTAVLMGGTWAKPYLIGWGTAAVLSAVPGYLMWFAKGRSRRAWGLCALALACQIAVMFLSSGGVRAMDAVVIVLTAAVLLADKVVRR